MSKSQARPLFEAQIVRGAIDRRVPKARSARAAAQSRHVRGAGHRRADHGARHPGAARPRRGTRQLHRRRSRSGCGSPCCSRTSPRPWPKGAARRRPRRCAGRAATCWPRNSRTRLSAWRSRPVPAITLRKGDLVVVAAGDVIPCDGDVIEGVASVDESVITGESAPVIRESGGDRSAVTGGTRSPLRLAGDARQRQSGRDVPGSHDRAGRGRQATEDAERDRAQHPARRADADLPGHHRDAAAVFALQRARRGRGHAHHRHRPERAAGLPDPDHHRRAAVGDRHRGHGPADPGQRDRHVGSRGRSGRRRGRAAARQDRHHHARQPPGHRVRPGTRRNARARWPTPRSSRRSRTRRPRDAASWCSPRNVTACASATFTRSERRSFRSARRPA